MVREGVPFGQKRAGTWVQLGKGGQEVERWRSFSRFKTALTHLFPDKSMQVVDFPCMYEVRVFRGRGKKEPLSHEGTEADENWNQGGDVGGEVVQKVTHCYAKVREVSRKSAKVRTDQARKSAIVRIVTGETNCFERFTIQSTKESAD